MKNFTIFTDGSCINNPGPGGYGIILQYNNYSMEFSQGYYLTTNNRMELISNIIALKYICIKSNINIYTDSLYVKNGITKWIINWKKNFWISNNKKIKNIDLWEKLYFLSKFHFINWTWIKGHSNNKNNNRCDKLAKLASKNPNKIDKKYLINKK